MSAAGAVPAGAGAGGVSGGAGAGAGAGAGGSAVAGAAATASREFALGDPPTDGISHLTFSPNSNLLLVSSWDTSVTLYDAAGNTQTGRYNHKAAVLACCFVTNTLVASGGLDKVILTNDLSTGFQTTLGHHDDTVKCLRFVADKGLVVSGSWDKTVKLWDRRAATALVQSLHQPERVYGLDVGGNRVVVAHAGNTVSVYDVRNMGTPELTRASPLKSQTRTVRMFTDGQGYALSSVDGRVAIEYVASDAVSQKKSFAFKCPRRTVDGVPHVFPVNALAFHPVYGTFATGGCDGYVCTWDAVNKRRVWQFHEYPTSIAALDFNHDGSLLAIAASYTYEQGEKDHPADAVYMRTLNDSEVKPKPKKAKGGPIRQANPFPPVMADEDDALTLAQDAVFDGDLEEAARQCKAAVEADDSDAGAFQLLNSCLMTLGRFDEAVDVCCDWGLGCGNSELQLVGVVHAAYLAGAAPLLQAGRDQMCTCEVSDLSFAECLALCADAHIGFGPAVGGRLPPPTAWASSTPPTAAAAAASSVPAPDAATLDATALSATTASAAEPVASGAGAAAGVADAEEKASGGAPPCDDAPPAAAASTAPGLDTERCRAYTLFTAGKVPGFAGDDGGGGDATDCRRRASEQFAVLQRGCSPLNVSFVTGLAVVLLLDAGCRAEAAEAVARGAARAPERDPNLVAAEALVDAAVTPGAVSDALAPLRSACAGATPVVRKRLLAVLADCATAK